MSRESWIFAAIVGGVVVLMAAIFFALFERREIEIATAPGPAARANAFLAAERLLGALGLETESVRGPVHLPPETYALVLATDRRTLGADRSRQLLDWVNRGGHLIVTPRGNPAAEIPEEEDETEDAGEESEARDAEDEVEDTEDEDDPDEDEDAYLGPDFLLQELALPLEDTGESGAEVVELRLAPQARAWKVSIGRSKRLAAEASEASYFDGDGHVARFQRGRGWITVLADGSFLLNDRIGLHEHASLLWSLVTTPHRPQGVWLVYRDQLPGLRVILTRRAWMVLASLAVLLAAWLWSRGVRFGPLLASPPAARRSLREHLEATGEFLWRHGQGAALVAGERQAVLHAVRRQHPVWSSLSQTDRLRYLAEISGLPGSELAKALQGSVGEDPDKLVAMISTLEKVRRSL